MSFPFKQRIFFVFIFLLFSSHLFSQHIDYNKLLHKTFVEKFSYYEEVVGRIYKLDSTQTFPQIKEIIDTAQAHKDTELVLQMNVFKGFYLARKYDINRGLKIIAAAKASAWQHKYKILYTSITGGEAWLYWELKQNYQKAFEDYIIIQKMLDNILPQDFPQYAFNAREIGKGYYTFREYNKAIAVLKRNLKIPENKYNSAYLAASINNLGLCFQKLGKYDQSIGYFQRVIDTKDTAIKRVWAPIASGNMGISYYHLKKYEKAVPLLKIDLTNAEQTGDIGRGVGDLIPLADIAINQNQMALAYKYIQKARKYIRLSEQKDRLRLLYPIINKWFILNNQPQKALLYVDSAIMAYKAYNQKFSKLKILKAQQEINEKQTALKQQKYKLKIAQLNVIKQKNIVKRNRRIALLIMLLFIIFTAYLLQRRIALKRKHRLEKAKTIIQNARENLHNFTRNIIEKNKLIENISRKNEIINNSSQLSELKQSVILTEEDWQKFNLLFEEAYPGSLAVIKERFPNLSPSLIRILALSKLNLSNKEMGNMLGVSDNSIRQSWHRIFKQLDLPDGTTKEDLVKML